MPEEKKEKTLQIAKKHHDLISKELDDDEEGRGGRAGEGERRIKYRDPFKKQVKQHMLLSDLAVHHQNHANKVQAAKAPLVQEKNLSNNFGSGQKNEFSRHPLLAGKPYFNGIDPKTTSLPSEISKNDSPEFNNARNELRLQKALKKEKQLGNEAVFDPKPTNGF